MTLPRVVGALLALSLVGTDAAGQIKASEAAMMSQTIDGTVVTMSYSRPSVRGRSPLFGGVVGWGHRWTPGANRATTLSVGKDVRLEGVEVPAGTWSVWLDVMESGPWALVLDPDSALYHTQPPDDADDQIRIEVEPGTGPHMDALLWYFASVRADGGELRMHWGETVVAFDLEVEPSQRLTVTPEEAGTVSGSWSAHWIRGDGSEGSAFTLDVALDAERAVLTGRTTGANGGESDMILVPLAEGIFAWGWGVDGELWEVTDLVLEFVLDGEGHADTVEIRGGNDRLVGRGERNEGAGP